MASEHRRLNPRKQPRQVRAELTRERILTAAAQVFAEHGYAAGTTNRIAERARISIGSVYQYYPNKDAILLELLTRHLDDGMASARLRRSEELPDSLEEIVRLWVRTVIEHHFEDPQLLRVLADQAPRSRELLEKESRLEQELVGYFQELLEDHPEVKITDTHIAARIVFSTLELVVHKLIASPEPIDLSRLENELVAMITRYLTAA
jgi:AcrR family transcriptional regulator